MANNMSPIDPFPTDTSPLHAAVAAAQAAIQRVENNAPAGWVELAVSKVRWLAERQDELTTDDLWPLVAKPPEPRAAGAVMSIAAKQKIVVATPRTRRSARKECHARPIRVWRSLLRN